MTKISTDLKYKTLLKCAILFWNHIFLLILVHQKTMIMKKIYLLAGVLVGTSSLFAQRLGNIPMVSASKNTYAVANKAQAVHQQKAEGDIVWSNDFGTSADWLHVSGVNQTAGALGKWQIVNAISSSLTAQGFNSTIQSVSGPSFALIDSDAAGSAAVQDAYLEYTGTINLSTLASGTPLYLEFTEYYRHYQEQNFIEVSIDGGTTWVTYEVNPSN